MAALYNIIIIWETRLHRAVYNNYTPRTEALYNGGGGVVDSWLVGWLAG